jgi:Ca-activated chloride channel family protein
MKINLDDPKLTAYALDELSGAEKIRLESALNDSPDAQAYVDELREFSLQLKSEYNADRATEEIHHSNIIPIAEPDRPWTFSARLALAAAIALFALIGVVALATYKMAGVSSVAQAKRINLPPRSEFPNPIIEAETELPSVAQAAKSVATPAYPQNDPTRTSPASDLIASNAGSFAAREIRAEQPFAESPPVIPEQQRYRQDFNTATYDHIEENPFLAAASNPLSTFSIDVDTASYSNARRFIESGSLPPKDAVRVEEMLNYFSYEYPQPTDDDPFSINLDSTSCPWEPSHRLVRIGLKGREVATDKRPSSNLVFLLDVSGSMMPPERLPLIKQSMRLLVEKLTENDRVAIVVYAGASGLALPSTTGEHKEQILSALENLQAGGSTNGAEGIELAYKTAAENFIKGGVNRVILATDGDFNIGVTNQGDLVRLIEEKAKSGVFLSVLGVGNDNLKDSTMQKLADKGNGNYAYLDSLDEARKVLVQQMSGTLVTIAKDVKIQVEFNPARVASYRLIGYEKRMLRKEDFNNDKIDGGEIGAGHTVTALYEVVPVGASPDQASSVPPVDPLKYGTLRNETTNATNGSDEMMTVKLRYKKPDGDRSQLIERSLTDSGAKFTSASADLKFAAAVAEFGMLLRDSQYKGNGTMGAVLEWAQEGKGADANGYRAGFIELVRKAQSLSKG